MESNLQHQSRQQRKDSSSRAAAQREQIIIFEYLRIFAEHKQEETYALLSRHIDYQLEILKNPLVSRLDEQVWKLEVLKKVEKLMRRVETVSVNRIP